MADQPSRRQFIQISLGAAFGASILGACSSTSAPKAVTCTDVSGLAPMDAQIRTALAYQDKSTTPEKTCGNCVQFVAGAPAACGTCKVVKGPINPSGYCKSWAAKPA